MIHRHHQSSSIKEDTGDRHFCLTDGGRTLPAESVKRRCVLFASGFARQRVPSTTTFALLDYYFAQNKSRHTSALDSVVPEKYYLKYI